MDTNLKIRNLVEDDYKELKEWWDWHRFKAPERWILPDNISDGLMVYSDEGNICAGFIYSTSSKHLFHVEWIVSTFKIKDKTLRGDALKFLINGLNYVGQQKGARVIYTSLVNNNLIDKYLACGWIKGSTNATEMVKTFDKN